MLRRFAPAIAAAVVAASAMGAGAHGSPPSPGPAGPVAPPPAAPGPQAAQPSPATTADPLLTAGNWLEELAGRAVERDLDVFAAAEELPPVLAQARDALRVSQYRRALRILARGAGELEPADASRGQLLAGIAQRELGAHRAAAEALSAAAETPALAFYARWQAAEQFLAAGDAGAARGQLAAIEPGPATPELALLRARIERALDDSGAAETWYRRAQSVTTAARDKAEIALGLAELAEARGAPQPELLAAYHRVSELGPGTRFAARAQRRVRALGGKVRATAARTRAARIIASAHATFRKQRNRAAERRFAQALKARDLTPELACEAHYYRAQSAFRQREYDRAAALFGPAGTACREVGNVNLEVKSAYQAGRALLRDERPDEAAEALAAVEAHPSHSYVDDARIQRAEALTAAGRAAEAAALLAETPNRFPDGDRGAEAYWRLAWQAYLAEDYATALDWIGKHPAGSGGPSADARAAYWTARFHGARGDRARALAGYRDCIERFPLGYYALQSLHRVRELNPAGFAALASELRDSTAPSRGVALSWSALFGDPVIRGALALLRLGLEDEAMALLQDAGRAVVNGRKVVKNPVLEERLWLAVYLADRAGSHPRAVWMTRWHLRAFRERWPIGEHRARWLLAFPRAYGDLVLPESETHGYPAFLQFAIMREESGFEPSLESWANAIGLTQMIMPTARRFARGSGLRVNRRTLRKPKTNVVVGSRFLGFLWSTFEGRVGLLVPAYNAGEARVWRWMRDRYRPRVDEWIENIPGDQARRYSKRVLGSYFAYSYLYGDHAIPTLEPEVPLALIPERFRDAPSAGAGAAAGAAPGD